LLTRSTKEKNMDMKSLMSLFGQRKIMDSN